MLRLCPLFLLSLLLFTACDPRKKELLDELEKASRDTVFPRPYFPVYPDSWWKYLNQNGDTVTKTIPSYELVEFSYGSNYSGTYEFPSSYVPLWDGQPCFGYSILHGGELTEFLREEASEWEIDRYTPSDPRLSNQAHWTKRRVQPLAVYTVNNQSYTDVLEVTEEKRSWVSVVYTYRYYYARNIGLIHLQTGANELQLIDHYIAPH